MAEMKGILSSVFFFFLVTQSLGALGHGHGQSILKAVCRGWEVGAGRGSFWKSFDNIPKNTEFTLRHSGGGEELL